ncbi:hypothetical protein ACJX0J_022303, partial [Zea mays]
DIFGFVKCSILREDEGGFIAKIIKFNKPEYKVQKPAIIINEKKKRTKCLGRRKKNKENGSTVLSVSMEEIHIKGSGQSLQKVIACFLVISNK